MKTTGKIEKCFISTVQPFFLAQKILEQHKSNFKAKAQFFLKGANSCS